MLYANLHVGHLQDFIKILTLISNVALYFLRHMSNNRLGSVVKKKFFSYYCFHTITGLRTVISWC